MNEKELLRVAYSIQKRSADTKSRYLECVGD